MSDIQENAIDHASENAVDSQAEATEVPTPEPDPITEILTGECPSVSGRSILTYAVGRHQETGE